VIAALATLAFVALVRSPAGRCMIAIRDNETLAESLGIPTWTYKLLVFMISAAFAGFGGSLYAHYTSAPQIRAGVPFDVLRRHRFRCAADDDAI